MHFFPFEWKWWPVVLMVVAGAHAQQMPQDSWIYGGSWGSPGSNALEFSNPLDVAVAPNGTIYIADNGNRRVQILDAEGHFLSLLTNGISNFMAPVAVSAAPDGTVVVGDSTYQIHIFGPDGAFIRKWGAFGTGAGQFRQISDLAITPDGNIVVADSINKRIQVFSPDGVFLCGWGPAETLYAQFTSPMSVEVDPDGNIMVLDRIERTVQTFTPDGSLVRKWVATSIPSPSGIALTKDRVLMVADSRIYQTPPASFAVYELDGTLLHYAANTSKVSAAGTGKMAAAPDGRLMFVNNYRPYVDILNRSGYRVAPQMGQVPLPVVTRCEQRPGLPYLDIDYIVHDGDSPTVSVAVAAFWGSSNQTFLNFLPISSLVDGTESAVGSNVAANVTNRISWNVAADSTANYLTLKVRVMAKDERGLMSVGFIAVPPNGTNSALTISSSPITSGDMLPVWFWLLANGDSSLVLSNGVVRGATAPYQGISFTSGTNTTAQGRTFLFDRMGLRLATTSEVNRAKAGVGTATNLWAPSITVGPGIRPRAVNEIGFDTGNWGTDVAWWVVKE